MVGSFSTNHFAAIDIATSQVSNLGLRTYQYFSDVSALYASGSTLYLGGRFASIGGEARQSFAGIDIKNNKLLPLDLKFDFNTAIRTIVIENGILHLGGIIGAFGTGLNTQYRKNLAAFSINNQYAFAPWNPLSAVTFSSPYDDIRSIEITPAYYYVGGKFTFTLNGNTYRSIARINRISGAVDAWQPAYQYNSYLSSWSVNDLYASGTRLYAAGEFGTPNNSLVGNFFNTDFSNGTTFYSLFDGGVNTIKRAGNKFYVGGTYTAIGPVSRYSAVAIDTIPAFNVLRWNPRIEGSVNDITLSKDRIYMGGDIFKAGGRESRGLVVTDTSTGKLWPWNPMVTMSDVYTWTNSFSMGTMVRKVVAVGDTVFVAGDFEDVAGKNITGLARFHFDNYQLPNVKIAAAENPACVGNPITYTAVSNVPAVNYEWRLNGVAVGNNGSTYNYIPANGDKLVCNTTVTGSGCYVANTATDTLTIRTRPRIVPSISITGPAKQVEGWDVTLNATMVNAGSSYSIDWRNNGVIFSTTTGPSITYTKTPGVDNITATVRSVGCYDTAISAVHTIQQNVGVNDITRKSEISVYPNPVKDVIHVMGLKDGDIVELVDVLGRKVQVWRAEGTTEEQVFNVANIINSHYLLNVRDAEGNLLSSHSLQK